MTLEKYTNVRMVVLTPDMPIYNAVRAMEENRIGAVFVHDGSNLVGILTDRDVALRLVLYDLDPALDTVRDVMTPGPAALPPSATDHDAVRLMLDQHVRRVPILKDGALVGVVTLDDLILDGAVGLPTLAKIVKSQLSEPARLKARGELRPTFPARPRAH